MKDDNLDEQYEEMSVGSGDAPVANSFINKKKFNTIINKRKIANILLLLIIIGLGIFFIIKSSYVSFLSDQNSDLQNGINSLSQKEANLKFEKK